MDGLVMYRTTSGAFLVFKRDVRYGAVATDQTLLAVSRGIQLVIAVEDPVYAQEALVSLHVAKASR